MVNEIIKEVNTCLNNGCYIAGLSLALTLPDICGKALYPELEKQTKQRYVKWFDEYIGQYEQCSKYLDLPYMSGEIVYSLRCSMLHQGNPNIEGEKFDIIYFELFYRQSNGFCTYSGSAQAEIVKDESGNDKAIEKQLSININDLCWKICALAEDCYNDNKEKFNFFNYNLVDIDFDTRGSLGVTKRGTIK